MLMTLIQKEIMQHLLSIRFGVLLSMCLLLIPLTLSINYSRYRKNQVDYQESVKEARAAAKENPPYTQNPDTEVSKLFLDPSPLSVFATGLEQALPNYLGMTRNGIRQSSTGLVRAPLAYAFGNLDFLFVVGTVFSLLALLFTFDAVAGERETGTLRITLSNALPRDVFLWSKLIGGYLVFVVPFFVSFLLGLLLLVWQGYPLVDPKLFGSVLSLTFISLLYIAVFFAIGLVISIHFDSSKTALIVAFTIWVLAALITPRAGFLIAKIIEPTQTEQSIYMEKTALRNRLAEEREETLGKKLKETIGDSFELTPNIYEEISKIRAPIEKEYRQKFKEQADKIDKAYQRQIVRQERMGEMLSRITPTSSFAYLVMNFTQTGKIKRDIYFQTGARYYEQLEEAYFNRTSDDVLAQIVGLISHIEHKGRYESDSPKIAEPPKISDSPLNEVWHRSVLDMLLLCFFAVVLITGGFLKFFQTDI